jgi:uncharacterized protein (TIGR00730 family)
MKMERIMKKICVFCGSSKGSTPNYLEAAVNLGKVIVGQGLDLVYGGGNIGLMGALSRTVLDQGGKSIGVIPKAIHKKVPNIEISKLYIVKDMHQRKAKMHQLADAFISLPGGIGTLEEFFEVYTWNQLGFHQKPVGLLNINKYFDGLLKFLDHSVKEGFLKPLHLEQLIIDDDPVRLINKLKSYQPKYQDKW